MGHYFKAYILITLVCLVALFFNFRCKSDSNVAQLIHNSNSEADFKKSIRDNFEIVTSGNVTNSSVLCVIMTSEKTFLERSVTVWQTWAKRCQKALFACNCKNLTKMLTSNDQSLFKNIVDLQNALDVPIYHLELDEKYDQMADKVFSIIRSVFKDYGSLYSWFLLTDDDTYAFVDNMNRFTEKRKPEDPLTYGYNYKVIVPTGYHSGGGGVLFTHEAFKRIANNIEKNVCNEKQGYGDVALGFCAMKSNVSMGNSLDEEGRERFHPLDYIAHHKNHIPDWLRQYASNPVKTGHDCCSDESITFHYTSPQQMRFFGALKDQRVFKEIYKTFN